MPRQEGQPGGEMFTTRPISKLATFGMVPEEAIAQIVVQTNQ